MIVQDFKGSINTWQLDETYLITGKDGAVGGNNFYFHGSELLFGGFKHLFTLFDRLFDGTNKIKG